jgi:hypothetical protein
MDHKKKKLLKKLAIIIPVVLLVGAIGGGLIYLSQSYKPMSEALTALESSEEIIVENERKWIIFKPNKTAITEGFIFYPGGNVEPESYSILARVIAENGSLVAIVKMPFDLAVFSPKRGKGVIEKYPDIINWSIGGHSLGGAMAAKYIHDSPTTFKKLILLAAYPSNSNNLSKIDLRVLSLYGSEDGVVSKNITATDSLLPNTTTFFEISGGNHANFGYYGKQKGDNDSTITREEQHNITISEIIHFLN